MITAIGCPCGGGRGRECSHVATVEPDESGMVRLTIRDTKRTTNLGDAMAMYLDADAARKLILALETALDLKPPLRVYRYDPNETQHDTLVTGEVFMQAPRVEAVTQPVLTTDANPTTGFGLATAQRAILDAAWAKTVDDALDMPVADDPIWADPDVYRNADMEDIGPGNPYPYWQSPQRPGRCIRTPYRDIPELKIPDMGSVPELRGVRIVELPKLPTSMWAVASNVDGVITAVEPYTTPDGTQMFCTVTMRYDALGAVWEVTGISHDPA